jgi:hypothetical protein
MNILTQIVTEKVKEILETPTAAATTAISTGLMGFLEIAYHVSQDALGWISLFLGCLIGCVVLKIKISELKITRLREKREGLLEDRTHTDKDDYDAG